MNELIAFCGLDCEKCEARIATLTNNQKLRESVAKRWSELNGILITPEMIACDGCRVPGRKTVYCDSLCLIKKCATEKHVETCASCSKMNDCEKLKMITSHSHEALENLKSMK